MVTLVHVHDRVIKFRYDQNILLVISIMLAGWGLQDVMQLFQPESGHVLNALLATMSKK